MGWVWLDGVGLGWVRVRWVEWDWDWAGLDWAGFGWIGLGWIDLGLVGLDCFGLAWVGKITRVGEGRTRKKRERGEDRVPGISGFLGLGRKVTRGEEVVGREVGG